MHEITASRVQTVCGLPSQGGLCCCRHQELLKATASFNEATNRLDRAASANSAFLGVLSAGPAGMCHSAEGLQA